MIRAVRGEGSHTASVSSLTKRKAFDAYQAHYQALNKIYGTYFIPSKAPSRSRMALDWIPVIH
jgi:hypothetical protein